MNLKNLIIIVFFTLFFNACKTKPENVSPPDYVLSKKQMVEILTDIHLAESYGYLKLHKDKERSKLMGEHYATILKIHKVETQLFDTSFTWYSQHPAVFEPIYDQIMETLTHKEKEINSLLKEEKDSSASKVPKILKKIKE